MSPGVRTRGAEQAALDDERRVGPAEVAQRLGRGHGVALDEGDRGRALEQRQRGRSSPASSAARRASVFLKTLYSVSAGRSAPRSSASSRDRQAAVLGEHRRVGLVELGADLVDDGDLLGSACRLPTALDNEKRGARTCEDARRHRKRCRLVRRAAMGRPITLRTGGRRVVRAADLRAAGPVVSTRWHVPLPAATGRPRRDRPRTRFRAASSAGRPIPARTSGTSVDRRSWRAMLS